MYICDTYVNTRRTVNGKIIISNNPHNRKIFRD